ncbi:SOUL family heme-binding protein [Mycobacterium spongiae]|uniref:Heme-binding protein n=1 Tax=Mycobacterium spongiae TaxID=886343 RepID=A0A975JW89_9MYCO|nr:heme-binding protein [Mycobacterium spongiae]QUR66832.1 heme-binding protein [Mycobacterium spongiae]
MLGRIAALLTQLGEAAGFVVGLRLGIEEPPHTVETTLDGLQIRRYGPRIAAETLVEDTEEGSRNRGFRTLAGYIFGGNHADSKIAMTAPVSQNQANGGQRIAMTAPVAQEAGPDDGWVIRFFMPATWTLDTLPAPNDDAVKLVELPAEDFAVLRFTGARGPRAVKSRTEELLRRLRDTDFRQAGPAVAWFYDPPFTIPCLRRNEVAVPVTRR